jgi:hypothetical protein
MTVSANVSVKECAGSTLSSYCTRLAARFEIYTVPSRWEELTGYSRVDHQIMLETLSTRRLSSSIGSLGDHSGGGVANPST